MQVIIALCHFLLLLLYLIKWWSIGNLSLEVDAVYYYDVLQSCLHYGVTGRGFNSAPRHMPFASKKLLTNEENTRRSSESSNCGYHHM